MALNIGANDVANNLSASIGANAMTLKTGIIIAIIFEFSGAMIAGGDVTSTIKKGIIDPGMIATQIDYIRVMISALSGGAIWLTIATTKGYPVSTTHSIVGGVMGAGIMAGIVGDGSLANGLGIVDWIAMAKIVLSWVISPLVGAIIAYFILLAIKAKILHAENKIQAAKVYVPLLIAAMSFVFSTYLILKGLKKIWPSITGMGNSIFSFIEVASKPSLLAAMTVAFVISVLIYFIVKPLVITKANKIDSHLSDIQSEIEINKLFIIPIIASVAALCFAHGSNDVANAIGPLAGIIDAVQSGEIHSEAGIPLWVMLLGAGGIVVGLSLFGAKMVKKIGSEVVSLNIVSAFSVNFSAATTVVIASQAGMPVSSTHIAIGAIVGIGFYNEMKSRLNQKIKKAEKKTKNSMDIISSLEEQLTSLDDDSINQDSKHKNIDEEYDVFKASMDAKKIENPNYHKTTDEEVILKRFNRKLKHLADQKLDVLRDIMFIELKLLKEKHNHKRMMLGLAGVEKETFIERGFAKKIVFTWIITVPSAAAISALVFILQRGFSGYGQTQPKTMAEP